MSDQQAPRKRVHRVNVSFSESAWATLVLLAERKDKTMSETLRDAIALEKFFQDALDDGARVLVENPKGRVREVMFR